MLVVDDVPANLQVVGAILNDMDVEIAMATTGPEALEVARADPPSLILLDVMMPGMSGLEVCRILKKDYRLATIPVIFLTACTETDDIVAGFEAGCVDYVAKPFREAELRARVRTHLQLHQLRSLLPICMHCQSIREENGEWERVDVYINRHTGVRFSHGLCPKCMKQHYGLNPASGTLQDD